MNGCSKYFHRSRQVREDYKHERRGPRREDCRMRDESRLSKTASVSMEKTTCVRGEYEYKRRV